MHRALRVAPLWLALSSTACNCTGEVSDPGAGPGTHLPPRGSPIQVIQAPSTALPPAPSELTRVQGTAANDSVTVSFDPFPGADDYRIYPLPADAEVVPTATGFHVRNATFRCAGLRTAERLYNDDERSNPFWAPRVRIASQVIGFRRTEAQATLGHVFVEPGDGREPIHALGDPDLDDPNVFLASRSKRYVREAEKAELLAQGWRDDGVAFYAPTAASGIGGVYRVQNPGDTRATLYVVDGPEKTARSAAASSEAFRVLTQPAAGTQPLMRVHYPDGKGHDELVAGEGRFALIRRQGNQAVFGLSYSGLPGPTTLVIEALRGGCPYQGHLSPRAIPAERSASGAPVQGGMVAFETPEQLRAKSPHGELYLNGQHRADSEPQVLARTFVRVTPTAIPMDWSETFSDLSRLEGLSSLRQLDFAEFETANEHYSIVTSAAYFGEGTDELRRWAVGTLFSQLWMAYGDNGANAKGRITPKRRFPVEVGKYLHVTMETSSVSTSRRYPQILISDSDWPVVINRQRNGNTVIVQPRETWPYRLEAQVCDQRLWDVNCQCPRYEFDGWSSESETRLTRRPPNHPLAESSGLDLANRYDVYLSRTRLYVFLDRKPFGCAILPSSATPATDATVTFGDVLYHSSAESEVLDQGTAYPFHHAHLSSTTRRFFDNLGISAGVEQPVWDEARFPCQTQPIPDGENCGR